MTIWSLVRRITLPRRVDNPVAVNPHSIVADNHGGKRSRKVLVNYYQRTELQPLFSGRIGPELRQMAEQLLAELPSVSRVNCFIHRLRYRWFLPERVVIGPGSALDNILERLERDYRWATFKFSEVEARLASYVAVGFGLCFELRFRSGENQGWVILEQAVLKRFDGKYEIHRYVDDR